MIQSLPDEFTSTCSADQRIEAESWWTNLPDASRSDIYVLLDTRSESRAFVFAPDEDGRHEWRTLPMVNDSVEVEDCDDDDDDAWITELLHYRLDHEDFVMATDMKVRTFHICSRHLDANRVIEAGKLTCDFRCTAREENCPIERFAANIDRAVLLRHNRASQETAPLRTLWLAIDKSPQA